MAIYALLLLLAALPICSRPLNVSARSFLTSLSRNISVCHFFLLVCSIFLKCRPAAANATVRSRERELRQAGARRVCFRPCLIGPWVRSPDYESGSRARMPASTEWLVRDQQLAFWSSPARRSAVEPSAFLPNTGVAGFAGFYLPGLSPHARSDGAAAFGDRKSSLGSKSV